MRALKEQLEVERAEREKLQKKNTEKKDEDEGAEPIAAEAQISEEEIALKIDAKAAVVIREKVTALFTKITEAFAGKVGEGG